MKKISNKKGFSLLEIMIALMVMALLTVVGVKSFSAWTDTSNQHITFSSLSEGVPTAISNIQATTGKKAGAITIANLEAIGAYYGKTGWDTPFTQTCTVATSTELCLEVTLPDATIATNLMSSLSRSTGSNQAISSITRNVAILTVKYAR